MSVPTIVLPSAGAAESASRPVERIHSIDALRGLVVFAMIFVNDIAGVSPKIVPGWMRHFAGKDGMTFVDLVFPGFLFIVGMSIPFALGSRLKRESPMKVLAHVLVRTISLLVIGILMVNGSPSTEKMGWSGTVWSVCMYGSALLAFHALSRPSASTTELQRGRMVRTISHGARVAGAGVLIWLALAYRDDQGQRMVSLDPFFVRTEWWGILGLIGWSYLVASLVFLGFRLQRTALLGCMTLLLCLYPASRTGVFGDFWLGHYVGIGDTLGALPSITVAGLLLSSILLTPGTSGLSDRLRFTLWFVVGCAAGALLLDGLYGINKNSATPSWCLWASAITGGLWLLFYWATDIQKIGWITKPFTAAGRNVLLAYLLSEMLPSWISLLGWSDFYGALAETNLSWAIARSAGCAAVILFVTAGLNRIGFRLRL